MKIDIEVQVDKEIRVIEKEVDNISEAEIEKAKCEVEKEMIRENPGAFVWLHSVTCDGKRVTPAPPAEYIEYWENMYRRQQEEIPNNEYEEKVLEYLGIGKSITECIIWLKEAMGIDHQEAAAIMDDLCERCNQWEIMNMTEKERSSDENIRND